jgi:hypothetical protein
MGVAAGEDEAGGRTWLQSLQFHNLGEGAADYRQVPGASDHECAGRRSSRLAGLAATGEEAVSSRPGSEAGEGRSALAPWCRVLILAGARHPACRAWKENPDGADRAGFIWTVGNSSRKPIPQNLNGKFGHHSARSSRHMPSNDGQILRNLRSHCERRGGCELIRTQRRAEKTPMCRSAAE